MRYLQILVVATVALTMPVLAGDIVREVRHGGEGFDGSDGGYFELGLGVTAWNGFREQNDPGDNEDGEAFLLPSLSGAYRFHGGFIEAEEDSFDGVNIGYSIWSSDFWSLDLLAASLGGAFRPDEKAIDGDGSDSDRNKQIVERDTFYSGAGMRLTAHIGDHIVQYRLVKDTHAGGGVTGTLRMGQAWQVRHWNIHGIVGAAYQSARANEYWWGIAEEEATARFPAYRPASSVTLEAQVGAAYPPGEHWVFRTYLRYLHLPEQINNSPLARRDFGTVFNASVSYVF